MDWDERIGLRLTLRDLSILLTTVDAGSMSKAASLLRVSQPAISKTIAQIERAVGEKLIERSSRGIEPTVHGMALLARSKAAFNELQEGVEAMKVLADPQAGELFIAANQVALMSVVAPVVQQLYSRYPGIIFNITPSQTLDEQVRELEQGNVELVIGRMAESHDNRNIDVIELFHDEFVVIAQPGHRWVHRKKLELAELMEEPWTFPPLETVTGKATAQVFRASGLGLPRITVVASSIQLHRRMVTDSGFLTLFPSSVARADPAISILPVALKGNRQSIGILTHKYRLLSPLAKLFIEQAYAIVADADAVASRKHRN